MLYLSDPEVVLQDHMGSDQAICQAARVSVSGQTEEANTARDAGLLNYLIEHRHGSPFEHTTLKFYIKAPIFVFREFHRHRAGWSYNEMSGRYMELPPEFYVPSDDRKLVNVGSSARPRYEAGSQAQVETVKWVLETAYSEAWQAYQGLLRDGIAKEVARLVLPVGIMSQMYATCNARSLMHFLSLRTEHEDARVFSHPQHEIAVVAELMEQEFAEHFPMTHAAFVKNGRVSP